MTPLVPEPLVLEPGTGSVLGATVTDGGINFALFSAHASAVWLCLFDPAQPLVERARLALPCRTDNVWHGMLPGTAPADILYAYRVDGPYAPHEGHRFNVNKLLIDPYARGLVGEITLDDALFGYDPARGPDSFSTMDSAPFMPRCRVLPPNPARASTRPRRPWHELVILETHPRGITRLHAGVPEAARGTYAGLASPALCDHLHRLGTTAVELLPVHEFHDEVALTRRGQVNYWGYNSIGFMMPSRRYAAGDHPEAEFADMVQALHAQGIEVLLDVVYNHTAENDELGPTLSLRGIDNASYYRLRDDDRARYVNDTGCGNMLDLRQPPVLRLVMDSLRLWADEMDVDGFRFDLAPILARTDRGFDPRAAFLACAGQDPSLRDRRLIAEPWDLGAWETGHFPPGWAEWNDGFRDTVRRFWRGEAGPAALAGVLAGSAAAFAPGGRGAWASINFVTAHDGFTLADLVSYAHKHNEANGEDNRDGTDDNHSRNCGAEGPSDDPAVRGLRARLQRSFVLTLLASRGTPMLLAGDEIGRSQQGNNNAYCQDGPIAWTDWAAADTALRDFVGKAVALRAAHPALHASAFLTGTAGPDGVADVVWRHPSGREMQVADWQDGGLRCLGMELDAGGDRVLVLLNGGDAPVDFALDGTWRVALSSDAETGAGRLAPLAAQWLHR